MTSCCRTATACSLCLPCHKVLQDGDGVFTRYLPAELLKEVNVVDTPGTNVILGRQQRLTEEYVPRADLVSLQGLLCWWARGMPLLPRAARRPGELQGCPAGTEAWRQGRRRSKAGVSMRLMRLSC